MPNALRAALITHASISESKTVSIGISACSHAILLSDELNSHSVNVLSKSNGANQSGGACLKGGSHTQLSPRGLDFTFCLIPKVTSNFLIPSK